MKNIKKIKSTILIIVIISLGGLFALLTYRYKESSQAYIGGWAASFIISGLFYKFSIKKEIAKVIEETTKNVESELNNQFSQHCESLNKLHNESEEVILKMYKTRLVNQLENDMAEIWDVRPGATVGADASLLDHTAMDNADDKYYKMYHKIHERSDEILNDVIKNY